MTDTIGMECPCCGAALLTCKCDVAIIDRDPIRLGWRRCPDGTHAGGPGKKLIRE